MYECSDRTRHPKTRETNVDNGSRYWRDGRILHAREKVHDGKGPFRCKDERRNQGVVMGFHACGKGIRHAKCGASEIQGLEARCRCATCKGTPTLLPHGTLWELRCFYEDELEGGDEGGGFERLAAFLYSEMSFATTEICTGFTRCASKPASSALRLSDC